MKIVAVLYIAFLATVCCELREGLWENSGANSSCYEDCCASLNDRSPTTYYYYINTGRFRGGNQIPEAKILTKGYSGQGQGLNNPDYQCKEGGPLPASRYRVAFCKNVMHQTANRPCSFYLMPLNPLQVCGRDDFFIHGCQCCTEKDSTEPPAAGCSAGCVIISYENRKKIRIGDTLIVQNYEPNLGVDGYQMEYQ